MKHLQKLKSGFSAYACLPAVTQPFTSSKKVNRGALLLKEKAATRKLQQAEERLKVVQQRSGRALRALGRKTGASQAQMQQPLSLDSSSEASDV